MHGHSNPHTAVHRWDEHFELLVHHPEQQSLTAELYDSNLIGRDEEIGRVSVPIQDLQAGEAQDLWLDLEPPQSRGHVANPLDAGLQVVCPPDKWALNRASAMLLAVSLFGLFAA